MPSRRYVLLVSAGDLTDQDLKELDRTLAPRLGKVKVIRVEGNPRAVIVSTTTEWAGALRDGTRAGKLELRSVRTSGVIGKLKREARGERDEGH